ncbi:MAG: hypothetical protein JXR37_04290 [Kiritimatiellae bacterium]|nr:hypothetical protein [Kiritimatiellia bacterium]
MTLREGETELLTAILSRPTAPFREARVKAVLKAVLGRGGVPHFEDPVGNLVAGAESRAAYAALLAPAGREAVPIFVAHMDHPGFHGVRWRVRGARLQIRWFGGAPTARLAGAPVWVSDGAGYEAAGTLSKVRLTRADRGIDTAEVRVSRRGVSGRSPAARALYGGFRFRAPFWRRGTRLYARAIDDLIGTFTVCAALLRVWAGRKKPRCLALFSRAEETGFIGTIAHVKLGWIAKGKRPRVVVNLEASRQLPNARIGRGPVLRLGDRLSVFDPTALFWATSVAQANLDGAYQRRLMDGGACEASLLIAHGVPAVGIAIPLGNYHNMGIERGADSRGANAPSPEFVDLRDVAGGVRFCECLAKTPFRPDAAWVEQREAYRQRFERQHGLLGRG